MRNTFVNQLLREAKTDKRIMLITGDLGYGVVDDFAKELPEQFVNFGINEQTMMSAAAGLANQGFKPFVYSIGNFPTFRCLEQIRNDVCYMNLDVTIVALGAGFAYGTAGYSHHLVEDISSVSPLPNIHVYSPADVLETELVAQQVIINSGPKYVRLGKGGEGDLTSKLFRNQKGFSISYGNQETLILCAGNILSEALKIQEEKNEEYPTIASCYDFKQLPGFLKENQFKKIITVEEHVLRGGFGSLVREHTSSSKSVVVSIGVDRVDSNVSGSQAHLREKYGLTASKIKALL
jgi:transketolase